MKRLSVLLLSGWFAASLSAIADPTASSATGGGLPPGLLKEYLGSRPSVHLVDPQQLLGEHDRNEFLRVLDAHAADSHVDVHVYLLADGQSPPAEPAVGEFVGRAFAADPPRWWYTMFWVPPTGRGCTRARESAGPSPLDCLPRCSKGAWLRHWSKSARTGSWRLSSTCSSCAFVRWSACSSPERSSLRMP